LIGAVEVKSSHPLSIALVNNATGCAGDLFLEETGGLPNAENITLLEGKGIEGYVNGV
jgi:cation transport ATPase